MNKEGSLDILFHKFLTAFFDHRIGYGTFKLAFRLWSIDDLTRLTQLEQDYLT